MERKRREDLEKLSSDAKELSHVKNVAKRLELKLAPMHQEIVELRDKLLLIQSEKYALQEEQAKNDEILELSALDKEMAEEKCENLLLELNELRERYDDLEVECEALREENALYEGLQDEGLEIGNQKDRIENIRLAKKNEQLQTALLKFRDLMQNQEHSSQEKVKSLESSAKDAQTLSDSLEQTKLQLNHAESVIADLRIQLDNALGAEDMIETLTDKNLELQERIEGLEATINELETLKALNDELESNHLLTEKQLLAEVDELEELHSANQEKLVQSDERNAYLESVVSKFKEVVTILESDLAELRTSNQTINADSAAMAQHTKSLMELNLKLSSTAVEANSKAMDLLLGKFEAQQALDQLAIVKCYLPNSYTVDEVAIEALLRLDRIAFKSEIIETFLLERAATLTSNLFSVVEYTKIFTSLIEVRRYSSGLAYFVKSSSIDEFQQCGDYYTQTEQIELGLSSLIDILKADALQEKSISKDLDTILHKLWALYTDCAKGRKEEPQHVLAINDLSSIQLSSRLINDTFNDLVNAMKEISLDPCEDPVITGVKSHLGAISRLKVLTTRISNELESLYAESKILPTELYEQLARVNADCKLLVVFFTSVLQRLRSSNSDIKPYSNADFINLLKKQFTNVFDPDSESTANITLLISEKLEHVVKVVKEFTLSDSTLKTITKPIPPWIQKETQLTNIKLSQAEKEKEIEALKLEVQRLATNVRARDKSMEELQVRLGLLNSKMEKSKDQVAKITEIKKALAESVGEEKRLQETITNLRKALTDQQKTIVKYKKSGFKTDTGFLSGDYQETLEKVAFAGLKSEISSLRAVIGHLSRLQSEEEDFGWLEPSLKKNLVFTKRELQFRNKTHKMFTDIRKNALEAGLVSIHRPKTGNSRKDRLSKSQSLVQKDNVAKIRLIISSVNRDGIVH